MGKFLKSQNIKTWETDVKELVTLRELIRQGEAQFIEAKIYFGHGTNNAWDEAVFLALHALNLPPDIDKKILNKNLTEIQQKKIKKLFTRRIKERLPAPYLINEAWFAGLPFYVDERVLIPRSSLGELIENKLTPWTDNLPIKRILDIGTGSGCIAIALAFAFPKAKVDATDISKAALQVAKINVKHHKVANRVKLIESDVFAALPNKTYDIIVSNPPYVAADEFKNLPKEYTHEPKLALAAGSDGLDIVTKILATAAKHLSSHGLLIVEVGNSEIELAKRFPNLPFIWLEFTRGEGGVFLLTKQHLQRL